jgi:hypothetical protein
MSTTPDHVMEREMPEHMFDTIDALIAAGDWTMCERRLRKAVTDDHRDLERLEEVLAYGRRRSTGTK